jgi:hypothetical protein
MQALISDWSEGPDDEALDEVGLGQAIALLASQINAANHRLLRLIARFDRSGGWREGGAMRSCAHWLAAHCGISLGAAREKVRVARQLEVLPELNQAFAGGELSYSKVRAVTRVATPENEGFMLGLAHKNSAGHLERLVSRYQPAPEPGLEGLLDADPEACAVTATSHQRDDDERSVGLDVEAARELARELFWFQDEDGMWVLHARLPPEQGQLVIKALQAIARPLEEERHDAWKAQQKARLQVVAHKLLQRRNAGDHASAREDAAPRNRCHADDAAERDEAGQELPNAVAYARAEEKISAETFSQHMNQVRADALVCLVEHFLAGDPDCRSLQSLKGVDRCQVVMHVDINTLREQRSGVCCRHGRSHFEDRPWLSPSTARRLSCDASLVTVLEDEAGQVLNVGRRSRIVPEFIRRALRERDGVCRYPGCQESEYVDAHHVQHWADGGETRLDNLVTLCRFHHRQLHRGCFDIRLNGTSAEIVFQKDQPAGKP